MADPNPAPPTDPGTDPAPADPPGTPAPPAPGDPGKTPPWGKPENFDADKAWELIQNLRNEKGDPTKVTSLEQRIADMQKTQRERDDALAKALGLKPDDAPPDPKALADQIAAEQGKTTAAEDRAAAAERQVAIYRLAMAGKHEGNPVALLDSSVFLGKLAEVDATKDDDIVKAVQDAIAINPSLKAAPAAPPFPGGPRTPPGRPDPGPGLPRLRDAYAQSSSQ